MFLCSVAALNVAAWVLAGRALGRSRANVAGDHFSARRLQLVLSAGYVFGCAFRSVVPVFDVPRLGLFDSWLSSALVGRSVATVAELCFACQWALITRETARATGSTFSSSVAKILVPLIVIAEVFSWYSVLTTSNFGHVIEESLWGISAALVVASMVLIRPRCTAVSRNMLAAWCLAGVGYVAYIFLVDVPMYWERWVAQEAGNASYLTLTQGVLDALHRRVVTYRLEDWRSEIVWMSMYFSVAVWISISLIYAPAPKSMPPAERMRVSVRLPGIARASAGR